MGAAKHIIQEYDLSGFVPKMSGIRAGIVINSTKGRINEPRMISTVDQYINTYGEPSPSNGVSEYSALNYLTYGGPMYIVRCAHNTKDGSLPGFDPKFACALVRTKVDPVPVSTIIPDPNFTGDPVVKPLAKGLKQSEIDSFIFDLYKTNREYGYIPTNIEEAVLNQSEMKVFGFEDLEVGQSISMTPTIYVSRDTAKGSSVIPVGNLDYCNPDQYIQILEDKFKIVDVNYDDGTLTLEFPVDMALTKDFPIYIIPYDLSANYEITDLEERVVLYDKLTLSAPIVADKGAPVRLVSIKETSFSDVDISFSDIFVESVLTTTTVKVSSTTGIVVGYTLKIKDETFLVSEFNAVDNTITFTLKAGQILDAEQGDEVTLMRRSYTQLENPPFVMRGINGSNQLIVTESDYIKNTGTISVGAGITNEFNEVTVSSKDPYRETQYWIHLNNDVNVYPHFRIYRMDQSEYEERDGFLVYADNQGTWGNQISIEITPSKYDHAFYLEVFKKGASTGEKFLVSRRFMKDGFNNQLYIESVINGNSNYIRVKNNVANIDDEELATMVLFNDKSLWRKDNEDVFQSLDSGSVVTEEDVIINDVEIMVSDNLVFSLGDRIKFAGFDPEYKVKETRVDVAGNQVIMLDRKILSDKIPNGTEIHRFHHIKYYPITILTKAFPGYNIPFASFTLAGEAGKLLDGGVNNFQGGHNGSSVTVGDLMTTADILAKDTYAYQLLLDGGFAQVAYQQKLVTIAEKRLTCFAYLSCDLAAEKSVDYLNRIIAYRNSTMLNTSFASIFSTHVLIYDQYNQMEVTVSPEAFAASQQAYVERNATMWTPAAGWTYGKIKVLGLTRVFEEAELDLLVENQINTLKYEDGDGISIWGNETMQTMPSYLSMRHVRILLIVVEHGLKGYMKYQSFKMNDQATRDIIVYNLNKFFKETVANGIYEFQVLDVTNDSNISNREGVFRMMFSPKADMEKIISQVVITSKGMDFSLVNI